MEGAIHDLMTVEEIADELRVSAAWVYMRTRMGQKGIPHTKFGRHLRFKKAEVLKFFDDQRQKANV